MKNINLNIKRRKKKRKTKDILNQGINSTTLGGYINRNDVKRNDNIQEKQEIVPFRKIDQLVLQNVELIYDDSSTYENSEKIKDERINQKNMKNKKKKKNIQICQNANRTEGITKDEVHWKKQKWNSGEMTKKTLKNYLNVIYIHPLYTINQKVIPNYISSYEEEVKYFYGQDLNSLLFRDLFCLLFIFPSLGVYLCKAFWLNKEFYDVLLRLFFMNRKQYEKYKRTNENDTECNKLYIELNTKENFENEIKNDEHKHSHLQYNEYKSFLKKKKNNLLKDAYFIFLKSYYCVIHVYIDVLIEKLKRQDLTNYCNFLYLLKCNNLFINNIFLLSLFSTQIETYPIEEGRNELESKLQLETKREEYREGKILKKKETDIETETKTDTETDVVKNNVKTEMETEIRRMKMWTSFDKEKSRKENITIRKEQQDIAYKTLLKIYMFIILLVFYYNNEQDVLNIEESFHEVAAAVGEEEEEEEELEEKEENGKNGKNGKKKMEEKKREGQVKNMGTTAWKEELLVEREDVIRNEENVNKDDETFLIEIYNMKLLFHIKYSLIKKYFFFTLIK